MYEIDMCLERHEHLHATLIPKLLRPLSPDQMRIRPAPLVNSIAWILWHMARTEDFAFTSILGERPQVLDRNWIQRLDVPLIHQGTGMSDEEVSEFSTQVDVVALQHYYDAVGNSTREVVKSLKPDQLGAVPDEEHVRRVLIDEGVYSPTVQSWGVVQRLDRPIWWWLSSRISHQYLHYGECITVRSLMGVQSEQ